MRILLTIILLFSLKVSSQNLEKTFRGYWANTYWEFHFDSLGNFSRISSGHYGKTNVSGRYEIKNDTIIILNGFENSHGTIARKYYLDFDEKIIDVENLYDYSAFVESDKIYTSKKRKITYIRNKNSKVKNQYFGVDNNEMIELHNFYFLNASKILSKVNGKIEVVNYSELNLNSSRYYDKLGRIEMLFYYGSLVSGIKPKFYKFSYQQDSFQIKEIIDESDIDEKSKFTFEYVSNQIDKVNEISGGKTINEYEID